MATIYVDGKSYEADPQTNLLQACLEAGLDLPYFCWHPELGSVGSCRQCAVTQYQDVDDDSGRLVMACMTPVSDGARIGLRDAESHAFRATVVEWMMTNHPHDCPVCEEGGECHLQDMTVMTGHNYRRFRFGKRTFENQDLGPFIGHEMNRCITCYRCVRFYNDYAGGTDLGAFSLRNQVYFGRHEEGPLENEFSGNLVEVCPTGVFTDKTLSRRYTRKWDLRTAPSVCTHCSLGCNTTPGERYGWLKRITNRYNHAVNGYFLCDRGRFGYDFVNQPERLSRAWGRPDRNREQSELEASDLLRYLGEWMQPDAPMIGIGSPRASVETNFALKTLVGADNYFTGLSGRDSQLAASIHRILCDGPARVPSLAEVENADAVIVLGEDVTQTAPRLALSLRQSVRNASWALADSEKIPRWQDATVRQVAQYRRSPLYNVTPHATRLDDIALRCERHDPAGIARLGHAIAHALDDSAPAPEGMSGAEWDSARHIAETLVDAERPLVVSGTGCQSEAVIEAAANISRALQNRLGRGELFYTLPEANTLGVELLGGGCVEAAMEAVREHRDATLIVAENDLYRRADRASVDEMLEACRSVIVLDSLRTATTDAAHAVFPAATFAEGDGTLVNAEGRAQRYYQVMEPLETIQESWRWFCGLAGTIGRNDRLPWTRLDHVIDQCVSDYPALRGMEQAAPDGDYRIQGLRPARSPHRYSGRTAIITSDNPHEPGPPTDPDSPLSFTMEGYTYGAHSEPAALKPFFWAPGWNSEQAVNKFQEEIGGSLIGGDPGQRLIESGGQKEGYFDAIPDAPALDADNLLAVPVHHIFGSEELSAQSPSLAERIPESYLGMSAKTLGALNLEAGQSVAATLGERSCRLAVREIEGLATYCIAVPQGMTVWCGATLPATIRLHAGAPDV